MKLKCFFVSMFAIAALSSCNNDDEFQGGTQDGNDSSWIGVSVSLPAGAFSRAVDGNDTNAEDVETAIKSISLYYKKADGSVDAISTTFTPSDFSKTGAVYVASKAAKVPFAAGETVDIYAAVNTPTANAFMPNWFNFKATAGNPDVNYWTAASATLSDAATGFTMTGTTKATTYAKETEALGTHSRISIERVVAKVLVTASDGGIDPTIDFEETNPNGSSGKFQANTLKWTVGNDNKKLYLLSDANSKDPNWEKLPASVTDAELDKEYSNRAPSSYLMTVPKFADVTATGYANGGTPKVQYCNENTNEIYQYGNTSFISIQTVFVPDNIVKTVSGTVAGNDLVMNAEANDLGAVDFYYNSKELKYFTAAAYNAATAAGVDANEFKGVYKNGECYYFVPIKNTVGEIGVLRNTYYTMRIKSLKAPGEPTSNSGDKDEEVEQSSWIAVDFDVAAWDPQSMGDLDLE